MAQVSNDKPQSAVINTGATWREYRRVLTGEARDVAFECVLKHYPEAAGKRDTIRTLYLPLLPYVMKTAAGAMNLPFRVVGNEKFIALMQRWRPVLARAWGVRFLPGSSFPHCQLHRERLVLEHIWSDRLEINADPEAPGEWDLVRSVKYSTGVDQTYTYIREDDGTIRTEQTGPSGGQESAGGAAEGWGVLPIFPMYRDDSETLQPAPDRTVLDMWRSNLLQLSDIEFRRANRVGLLYIRRDGGGATRLFGGQEVDTGPDMGIELSDQDQIGMVESSLKPSEDLDYIEGYLRLCAKLLGLPPELFIASSRAETGAAKSWDYAPLLELQQADREAADEWLAAFIEYIRPIIEAEKILEPGERVRVRTVAPKRPAAANSFTWAMGMEKLCRLRITSPVKIKSETEGLSLREAERIIKINDEQCEAVGIPRLNAGDSEEPSGVSGDAAAVEP